MKFDLRETAREHTIIVAHRGIAGGNIPCNTLPAYNTALLQGADMIETDLNCTADGKLVILHPGMEKVHLDYDGSITDMPWEEVAKLRYRNFDGTPTQFGLIPFDDLLEEFKGRCYINIDKFWSNPEAIYRAVKRHDMLDQILVKSHIAEDVLDILEQVAPELAFMPIVKEAHPHHEALMGRNINYVGVEVLFRTDDNELAGAEFAEKMHRDGKLVWVNSIVYNYQDVLAGGHSDDTALSSSMEEGWGWIGDRPFDVIQTDWPGMLVDFLKRTGRYYK
ncbi:MAG: glycerophosphodiester phosphodiesterase family protein [Clostridia bacterium]|nr:glycerophosphodiester phosphodiesterase family protein [Clostridia bacterium]MBQ6989430.1 glycerophosphodiester phosphodiesterase family protein [Clostridia bacterium]